MGASTQIGTLTTSSPMPIEKASSLPTYGRKNTVNCVDKDLQGGTHCRWIHNLKLNGDLRESRYTHSSIRLWCVRGENLCCQQDWCQDISLSVRMYSQEPLRQILKPKGSIWAIDRMPWPKTMDQQWMNMASRRPVGLLRRWSDQSRNVPPWKKAITDDNTVSTLPKLRRKCGTRFKVEGEISLPLSVYFIQSLWLTRILEN